MQEPTGLRSAWDYRLNYIPRIYITLTLASLIVYEGIQDVTYYSLLDLPPICT